MRKVLLVVPWLLVAAGIALVAFAGSQAISTFLSAFSPAAQWQTPAVHKVQLAAGSWMVFQRVPTSGRVADSDLLDPQDITVFGPQGRVATSCVYCSGSETLTLGTTRYVGIIRFGAAVDGEYTVATEVADETLIVSPPAIQTVGQTFVSLAWLGLGAVLLATGVVWLIVLLILRLTRDDRRKTPSSPTWTPPSGPPVA